MDEETTECYCTDCGATVAADAKSCLNCGAVLDQTWPQQPTEYVCSACGTTVDPREKTCPECGACLYIQYYSLSTTKLALLSLCSLGVFQAYWFYKNWAMINDQERRKLSPWARGLLFPLFCYALFRRVMISADTVGYAHAYSPALLAVVYLAMTQLYRLPGPLGLAVLFSYAPLLTVQRAINFNNGRIDPGFVVNNRLSAAEIILCIVGGSVTLWLIVATLSSS